MSIDTSTFTTSRVRLGAFYLAALAFLGVMAAMLGSFLLAPLSVWVSPPEFTGGHLIHDVAFAAMMLVAFVGVLIQFYRPARRVAAAVGALVVVATLIGSMLVGPEFFAPALVFLALVVAVAALHPAGVIRSFRGASADRRVLAMVALAAVPATLYAAAQLGLQFGAGDDHAAFSHYAGMAAYVLVVLALGLLGATDVAGSRFTLWTAGLLGAYLGVVSIAFAVEASAVAPIWAGLAILWGVAVVAVGEFDRRRARRTADPAVHGPTVTP